MEQEEVIEKTEASEVKKLTKSRKTTLKELGANFPIYPTEPNGKQAKSRSFSFLDWDMKVEEEFADIQRKNESSGFIVSGMMNIILDSICGEDFHSQNENKKILFLNGLEYSNMMYLYLYLRYDELGPSLKLPVSCPSCTKHIDDFVVDLGDLDIECRDEDHKPEFKYPLEKPITLDDGEIVTSMIFGYVTWDMMERASRDMIENVGKMKRLAIVSGLNHICNSKGKIEGFRDRDTIVNKLKKIDIERISEKLDEHNGGPVMAVSGKCPSCRMKFHRALDWSPSHFFDSSSL